MKPRRDPPSAERMKQNRVWVVRLVGVVFVPKFCARMLRLGKCRQLAAEDVDLRIAQNTDTAKKSVFLVELNLIVRQQKRLYILSTLRNAEEIAEKIVLLRKIVSHNFLSAERLNLPL